MALISLGLFLSGSQRKPWTKEKILDVINNVREGKEAANTSSTRTSMQYYWMSKYDVMTTANVDHLIFKRKSAKDPMTLIIPREEYFEVLMEAHKSCGHGGRDKILNLIKSRFYIPKKAVEIFVSHCPTCANKRNVPKKGIISNPIASQDFNVRGQVDLIDFRSCPDGEYKWLLIYQDNATKFINLRPLKTKRPKEVAVELLKIFMTFGAPYTLQSESGCEFTPNIVKELTALSPICKIVQSVSAGPQTQESIESIKLDVENMLRSWMDDNKLTNWSLGCYYVQYKKNISSHSVIGKSPYKAVFGNAPKARLSGSIPSSILTNIESEEQLKNLLEQELDDEASGANYTLITGQKPDEPNENLQAESVIIECGINLSSDTKSKPQEAILGDQNQIQTDLDIAKDNSNTSYADLEIQQIKHENVLSETDHYDIETVFLSNKLETYSDVIKNEQSNNLYADLDARQTKHVKASDETDLNDTEKKSCIQIDIEPVFICEVCQKACTDEHSCSSCKNFVHLICGLSEEKDEGNGLLLCFICKVEQDILFQRNEARKRTKRTADKIVDNTAKKLHH